MGSYKNLLKSEIKMIARHKKKYGQQVDYRVGKVGEPLLFREESFGNNYLKAKKRLISRRRMGEIVDLGVIHF